MPFGAPSSPTVGQVYPTSNPVWQWDGSTWIAISGVGGSGSALADRLALPVTNTDDFIALRGGLPYLVAGSDLAAYAGGSPAATAPAAFTAGQWTAAATATPGEISFNLTALPSDGGSAITALQYRVGTGAAIAFAGTGTGVRAVTAGLTAGAAADLQVRAVNAVGAGAWSDIKNRTPAAAPAGLAIVSAPAATANPFSTNFSISAGAAFGAGHAGVLVVRSWTSSVSHSAVDSNGDAWTKVYTHTGPDEIYSFFVRNGVAAGVTSVTVSGSSDAAWEGAIMEVSGQGAGLVLDGAGAAGALASNSQHDVAFTSTAEAIVLLASSLANAATSTGIAPLSVKSAAGEYGCVANGLFPTPGAQNASFTIAAALSGYAARVVLKAS